MLLSGSKIYKCGRKLYVLAKLRHVIKNNEISYSLLVLPSFVSTSLIAASSESSQM